MPGRAALVGTAIALVLAAGAFVAATRHMGHSVWFDESQTHLIASQPTYSAIMEMAREIRPYPPLYFFVAHHGLRFWPDERGPRIPSALFGALAIVAVFLLGREITGELAGVIAACLFALTPGAFRYFVDGNPYSLLMLASALSTLFLLRAARTGRGIDWGLYGVFALMGLATHALFVFHLGAQLLAGFYLVRKRNPAASLSAYKGLAAAAVVLLAAAGTVAIFVSTGATGKPVSPARMVRPETLVALAGMYVGPLSLGHLALLGVWCPLQALGAAALFRQRRPMFWGLAVLIGVSLLSITAFLTATLDYVAYRYAIGVFPLACVVAAHALRAFPGAWWWRVAAGAAVAAYCVAGAVFIARAGEEAFGYQDWRNASAYLARSVARGDIVVPTPDFGELPLRYYYKAPGVLPAEGGKVASVASGLLPAGGEPGPAVWVVFSSVSNQSRWVARFTEAHSAHTPRERRDLLDEVTNAGLAVCGTAEFQRIVVWEVRRGACPAAER